MKLIAVAAGVLLVLVLVYALRKRRRAQPDAPPEDEGGDGYAVALGHYDADRHAEAEAALRQVVQARPGFPEAHYKLGNTLAELGRLDEAEAMYRQALRLKPDFHQVHNNLGNLLRFAGRRDEAEACFRAAVDCEPGFPEALSNLGILLVEAGRLPEAEEAFRQALRSSPARFDLHYNLAQLLYDSGRLAEAEAAYRQVLRLNRDFSAASAGLGVLLAKSGRPQEAQLHFRDTLRLNPGNIAVHNSLGLALAECGQFGEAEAVYRQGLAIQPGDVGILTNLAILLAKLGRVGEAEPLYRQALDRQPGQPETLNSLGALYLLTGRWQEAEATFRHALQVAPSQAAALNLAHLDLLQGDFERGWQGLEQRWQVNQAHDFRRFAQPRWDGRAFLGKTLLVHYEQGAGDGIQFFRYLPKVAAMGGRLVVECPASLYRLFRDNLPGEVQLVRCQEALPDFDLYCPLMSLPLALQTRLETIPAALPYLKPPTEAVARSPVLTPTPGAQVLVGVLWAGNPGHHNDRNRSLDFSLLEPLLATPGVTWVILQMERRPDGFERLAAQHGWLDPMGGVKDFADTAAIIAQLDLVIGVDTSVIHLAGALGKPVWLLLPLMPDWRWLLGREDSPWYPGMRLFRQIEYNAWPEVVRRVACALPAERDALTAG